MSGDYLGLNFQDLVAGFAGGIANSFIFRKSSPWSIMGSIVVGGFAANYLSSLVTKMLGTSTETSAFIIGLSGMAICQGIIESAGSWKLIRGQNHE